MSPGASTPRCSIVIPVFNRVDLTRQCLEALLGFARACNRGASAARGAHLVFLNNDTIPLPDWLDALVEAAEAHPRTGVVGSRLLFPDGRIQHAGVVVSRLWQTPYHVYQNLRGDHPIVCRRRELRAGRDASSTTSATANGFAAASPTRCGRTRTG
jgi:glycosyltransferase involved in cell wall biosynthesis